MNRYTTLGDMCEIKEYFFPNFIIGCTKGAYGNFMASYFKSVAQSFARGKMFRAVNKKCSHSAIINNFPCNVSYTELPFEIDVANSRLKSTPSSVWECGLGILESIQPIISKVIKSSIPKNISPVTDYDVLLHFRCSDSPLNRHGSYEMPYYSFYKKALQTLNIYNGRVCIMSCVNHRIKSKKAYTACREYRDDIAKYLKDECGARNVSYLCQSFDEDFATMVYAPSFVSSGSSMAYMAALASNNPCVILETKIEKAFNRKPPRRKKWHTLPRNCLPHSKVEDYFDTSKVCKQLRTG